MKQKKSNSHTVYSNPDHHDRKFWNPSHTTMTSTDLKPNQNPPTRFIRKVKHEVHEMGRVTCSMLRCQASKLSYLFIPFFISIFWLVIMLITTRNPNATLEDKYIRVSSRLIKNFDTHSSYSEFRWIRILCEHFWLIHFNMGH